MRESPANCAREALLEGFRHDFPLPGMRRLAVRERGCHKGFTSRTAGHFSHTVEEGSVCSAVEGGEIAKFDCRSSFRDGEKVPSKDILELST